MMSKWAAVKDVTEFNGGGQGFEPIPDKTVVRGTIESVKHKRFQNKEEEPLVVELKFQVLEPEAYNGKAVYLNLKINDPNEKAAGKAMTAFAAIDAQMAKHYVGTELEMSIIDHLIEQDGQGYPYEVAVDDETLTMAWVGQGAQFLTLRLGLTKPNDEGKQYQWLMQVLPAGTGVEEPPKTVAKPASTMAKMKQPPKPPSAPKALPKTDDSEIPFS